MRYVELDGKRYEWKEIRRIRREQIQAALKPQLTLFELRHDSRPTSQQTASGRYQQPLLFKE
jgi:hypothetical protein